MLSSGQLVTVFGIGASCLTALLVGYWHRKQIRQLELYRENKSLGVIPPPSAPVAFLARNRRAVVAYGLPLLSLLCLLKYPLNHSGFNTLFISLNVASIYMAIEQFRRERDLSNVILFMERHLRLTSDMLKATNRLTAVVEHTQGITPAIRPELEIEHKK